jgi:hypothetical protein
MFGWSPSFDPPTAVAAGRYPMRACGERAWQTRDNVCKLREPHNILLGHQPGLQIKSTSVPTRHSTRATLMRPAATWSTPAQAWATRAGDSA